MIDEFPFERNYKQAMTAAPPKIVNRTSYRIIYGDTDQMGVVYYANYLRWFEKRPIGVFCARSACRIHVSSSRGSIFL